MPRKDFASMASGTLLSSAERYFIKVANLVYATANQVMSEKPLLYSRKP